ncbi:beta-aspartyl-peptidase [Alkalihalobacillus sp. AL-G]|uniref:beta-aspartyl-peptidase n=1 Tax=Alkalihalobacillus sp. AL-G TaxID=2926399 RepID=UPI002729BB40|nr:beta-aspartyl-peptidase [Alkalihalobacillus sp. AL-G]WLD94805.1 beta-aspartyl-peptidase [Alkalihalobacillus sp. AL-G]
MIKLIRNGTVFSPEKLGKKDILITDKRIAYVGESLEVPERFVDVEVIDADGKYVVPGFIDSHVHIMGGGGEGGFKTRTPELMLSEITCGGITTVIGVIGTDGTTRTMSALVAKANALEEEGITCFVHTGSYQVPVKTLTGSIEQDILLIDRIIGVGEIAISDHRSSQPTIEELTRLSSDARVGGLLSGKAGIVNFHIGDSPTRLTMLEEIVNTTDIPITQFHPTHINRNRELFEDAIHFAKKGGYVDFTTSTIQKFLDHGEVKCSRGLKEMLESGVPIEQITFTSDGHGSLPEFNENGEFIGLGIGQVTSLYEEVRSAVLHEGVQLEQALQVVTSTPAKILKLDRKGRIKPGNDADLVILDADRLEIDSVIAKGKVMVQDKHPLIKGTFEK